MAPTFAVAGVYALAACGAVRTASSPAPGAAGDSSSLVALVPPWYRNDLRQPRVIESQPVTVNGRPDRVLDATLEVVFDTILVQQAGGPVQKVLRTYRARAGTWTSIGFPGPTFRVSPGDSVRIKLVNRLPPSSESVCLPMPQVAPATDTVPDCFHGFNYTNIHYHGFHVSPSPNADDVLLQVAPGDSFQYAFRIPRNQSPGTHWYHPHKHGSVAIQVVNGMAGGFVVVDSARGLDSVQVANNITEKLLAFQQISDSLNLMTAPNPNAKHPATLVNGQYQPQITMVQGEVQRWRIVNENMTKTAAFGLSFVNGPGEEPVLFEVARDGVQFAPANYDTLHNDTILLLAPGNRLDVLVRAGRTTGVFTATVTHIEHVGERGDRSRKRGQVLQGTNATAAASGFPPGTTPVLTVKVVAPGTGGIPASASRLPTSLPALPTFLANIPGSLDPARIPAASTQVVVFASSGTGPGTAPRFFLGTEQDTLMRFNAASVYVPRVGVAGGGAYRQMNLDSVQTWKVVNRDTAINHPFHIHINPFQVVYVYAPNAGDSYQPLYQRLNAAAAGGNPVWMDVLPLPEANGNTVGYALIRQQYEDFPGWYVMHCHILGHEERGMMQVLQVVAPGDVVRPPPPWVTNPTQSGAAAHRH
jgi:FtsP/CotA-like multicopper oxidase with cupredoxin domain